MRCFRLRWCGVCGEVAVHHGACPFCEKRYRATYRKTHPHPKATPAALAKGRRYKALRRLLGHEQYLAEKEAKRLRYATDPAFAEKKRRAAAERYRLAHPEPAQDGRATARRIANGTEAPRRVVHESQASMRRGQRAA